MLKKLKGRLRYCLRKGFWFPSFRESIKFINNHLSISTRLNRWLKDGDNAPLGVAELYQFILAIVGSLLLIVIDLSNYSILQSKLFQITASVIAIYVILELFIFSLDWIFVAEPPLESYRRSLATFLFNIFQVSLYFTLLLILCGCYGSSFSIWDNVYANLVAMMSLQVVPVKSKGFCTIYSEFQRLIGATLMVIIVASLVGAVIRDERKKDKVD